MSARQLAASPLLSAPGCSLSLTEARNMNHSAVNGPNVFINYLIKLYGALVASLGLVLNGRNNVHYL